MIILSSLLSFIYEVLERTIYKSQVVYKSSLGVNLVYAWLLVHWLPKTELMICDEEGQRHENV